MKAHSYIRSLWILLPALFGLRFSAVGQHTFNNAISQYYRDGFLWNPAMAGKEGTRFYGLVNSAWAGFDGSATQAGLSADMHLSENMGIGINLASSSAGAYQRYAGAVAYAYDLKIRDKTGIRLGADLSLYKEHLDSKELVSGGQLDPVASSFNEKGVHFDGDFGAGLYANDFQLDATGYNLGSVFKHADKREADLQIAQILSSYRFRLPGDKLSIEPLAAYKFYYQADNIFLVAAQLQYEGVFHTSLYWQSTGSVMGGLGFMLKDRGEINFFYASKNKYGYHDQYEVGLKFLIK